MTFPLYPLSTTSFRGAPSIAAGYHAQQRVVNEARQCHGPGPRMSITRRSRAWAHKPHQVGVHAVQVARGSVHANYQNWFVIPYLSYTPKQIREMDVGSINDLTSSVSPLHFTQDAVPCIHHTSPG